MEILYNQLGGVHSLMAILTDLLRYTADHGGSAFKRPARLPLYNKNIADNATTVVRVHVESAHRARLDNYASYETAKCGAAKFLRKVVDKVWYNNLKDADTFYTKVLALKIMAFLDANSGGLHIVNMITLRTNMHGYYAQVDGIPQAELTLNLLRQAMLNPRISAWEFFQGPFDFNKMPLGPVGCWVLIHVKPSTHQLWDYWAKNGFYIGPALDSYCCFQLVNADTKSQLISDTVEFCYRFLAVPSPSTEDKIIHGLQVVAGALSRAAPPTSISQVDAIANLWDIFKLWHLLAPPTLHPSHCPTPGLPRVHSQDAPRVAVMQLPTPMPMLSPSPAWIPPPWPNSSLCLPLPAPPAGHATPP
jgi:hypothetical protein